MGRNGWAARLIGAVLALTGATASAGTYYFHTDHLGTPQVLTDANGSVAWEGRYEPFGEVTETVAQVEQNLRFPGQYLDRETGLHQNWFRDYDPGTGRYIQPDPIGLAGGLNTYAYALSNPTTITDPKGLNPGVGCLVGSFAGPIGCGAGSVVGAAIAGGAIAVLLSTPGDSTSPAEKNRSGDYQCDIDEDPCNEIIRRIDIAKNGIARRFRQLREDAGGINQATHVQQLKGRQAGLRKLINQALVMGCAIPKDAWHWATIRYPA